MTQYPAHPWQCRGNLNHFRRLGGRRRGWKRNFGVLRQHVAFWRKIVVFIREEGALWGTGWRQPPPWRPQRLPSSPPFPPRILILSRKRPVAPNQWEEPVGKVGGPTGWEEPRGGTPVMGGAIGWDPTNRRSLRGKWAGVKDERSQWEGSKSWAEPAR